MFLNNVQCKWALIISHSLGLYFPTSWFQLAMLYLSAIISENHKLAVRVTSFFFEQAVKNRDLKLKISSPLE